MLYTPVATAPLACHLPACCALWGQLEGRPAAVGFSLLDVHTCLPACWRPRHSEGTQQRIHGLWMALPMVFLTLSEWCILLPPVQVEQSRKYPAYTYMKEYDLIVNNTKASG